MAAAPGGIYRARNLPLMDVVCRLTELYGTEKAGYVDSTEAENTNERVEGRCEGGTGDV